MLLIKVNSRRSKEVIIFFRIYMGVNIVSIVAKCYQYNLVNKIIRNSGELNVEEVNRTDLIQQIVGILSFCVVMLLAIFFIRFSGGSG